MSFAANEFVWVPPLNSGVNLDVSINGKKVQQQFVVDYIVTEYEKYPGESQFNELTLEQQLSLIRK
jgi:hypothetical protein